MREDMARLLVLRARLSPNRSLGRSGRVRGPLDETPLRESMSPNFGGSKVLNEYFAPLKRFLRSSVGRPWDEVYSEIRERLSPRSAVHMHIMQHLFQFVERHVVLIEGRPHDLRRRSIAWSCYVCPVTGLLLYAPGHLSPKPRREVTVQPTKKRKRAASARAFRAWGSDSTRRAGLSRGRR